MKLIMASILAFSVSVSAMANTVGSVDPKATVSLKKVGETKIQLTYGSVPEGTVLVKIFDEKNFLIQNDRISVKNAFTKKYDFSKINEGKYHMEVYDQDGMVEQLALDFTEKKSEPIVYSKLEKMEGDKYKLVVNSLLPSDLTVFIYEDNRLIHEEKLEDIKGFQKMYVFNKLNPKAKLEFYLRSDDGLNEMLAAR
jgi:hypothetical protein